MAIENSTHPVPAELLKRFFPEEKPRFEVLRTVGEARLWKSTSMRLPRLMVADLGPVESRYHVTVRDEERAGMMRRLDTAIANFDLAVLLDGQRCGPGPSTPVSAEPAMDRDHRAALAHAFSVTC